MNGSVRIGKVYGISILLHYSWFLIFALLAWSLASGSFPEEIPGKSSAVYWTMGIMAALLLFVSVLLHELSHSLVAIKNKISVHKITLFFFGGIAEVKDDKFTPKIELLVAMAGPLMSLSLAGLFFAVSALSASAYVKSVFGYLFSVNLMLGLFNLAPGFPLDGGRIFRAILWWKWKDLKKATYAASKAGRLFAIFMIAYGGISMFTGGFGLWYVLLGLFLYSIAGATYEQTILRVSLDGLKVKDAMSRRFKTLNASMDAKKFDFKKVIDFGQEIFPVMQGKKLVGLTSLKYIGQARNNKEKTLISSITVPLSKLRTIAPEDSCMKAYEIMAEHGIDMVPVMKNGKMIGIVKAATLGEMLKLAAAGKEKRI